MNNYYDLLGTNTPIPVTIELEPIGTPTVSWSINNNTVEGTVVKSPVTVTNFISLFDPLLVSVTLSNKTYSLEHETAIVIKRLTVDGVDIVPRYDYLTEYINDHNNTNPTSYLGFNGKWTLTINRPFYQWLHQVQGQGWLLD